MSTIPAIRVSRDNVALTIEIEASVDPPEASFHDAETNSWQEPHPNFAKQVHELEKVSDGDWAWCDVTVNARFERYDDVEMLERFFAHGNWAIPAAVQHHDLIFVNQVNGGDEWWTLKIDGNALVPFESVSFRLVIERGQFRSYIQRLRDATVEQCRKLAY